MLNSAVSSNVKPIPARAERPHNLNNFDDLHRKHEGGLRTHALPKPKPLISVITVVFNGAKTLEQSIVSVLEQSYDNFEYLVIDGGSTDATLDILRRFDDHIDYWLSETDHGIYDAMNKGIALARGEYIGFLNSDDFFSDSSVLELIATRLMASKVDAVFAYLDIIDPVNPKHVLRKYRISSFNTFMLRIGVMPPHPTFYCRRTCYEKAGLYRTDYRIAADFEMLVRLLYQHHVSLKLISQVTIKMRSGGVSTSGLRSNWVVNREILRACKENGLYTNIFLLALKLPIRLLERLF